jgi:hypothetical protein
MCVEQLRLAEREEARDIPDGMSIPEESSQQALPIAHHRFDDAKHWMQLC